MNYDFTQYFPKSMSGYHRETFSIIKRFLKISIEFYRKVQKKKQNLKITWTVLFSSIKLHEVNPNKWQQSKNWGTTTQSFHLEKLCHKFCKYRETLHDFNELHLVTRITYHHNSTIIPISEYRTHQAPPILPISVTSLLKIWPRFRSCWPVYVASKFYNL